MNISLVVPGEREKEVIQALHSCFFEDACLVPMVDVDAASEGETEVVKLGNMNASRLVLQPGWRWSECIKPVVGGDSCQAGHVGVIVAGQMTCIHDDGSEITVKAGDAYYFAPGHDGWVDGDEPCIMYEIVETGKDFGPWKSA